MISREGDPPFGNGEVLPGTPHVHHL